MNTMRLLGLCLFSVCLLFACADMQPANSNADGGSSYDGGATFAVKADKSSALTVDLATELSQTCNPGGVNPTCNAWGAHGQRLECNPFVGKCEYLESDANCTYDGAGNKTCKSYPCLNNDDCIKSNPYPGEGLVSTCIGTESSILTDPKYFCAFLNPQCTIMEGSKCENKEGLLTCENNSPCTCIGSANMALADKVETCNGIDDDCDGVVDNGCDDDVDGYCDVTLTVAAGATCTPGDCNDTVKEVHPKAAELCDGVDNDCNGNIDESFSVGAKCDGTDTDLCQNGTLSCKADKLSAECVNETKKDIAEVCDGVDNDCNGNTDETFSVGAACDGLDLDSCKNGVNVCSADKQGVTCVEQGPNIVETCNGKDDTCDGKVDEGCDADNDGYCTATMAVTNGAACKIGDCNDADAKINPSAKELCDTVDNDCSGQADDGIGKGDVCTDGLGKCYMKGNNVCAVDGSVICSVVKKVAEDKETCNGLDDTCDGTTDEGCDDDNDGFCDGSMDYVNTAACKYIDCNDSVVSIYNGATEVCNGADDNCDGDTDEGCDDDGDKYCDASMIVAAGAACTGNGKGIGSDCDDTKALVNPDVEEVCLTAYDDNCDGSTVFKLDGKTPACDSCQNVIVLECGQSIDIDMAAQPNASNTIETYQCGVQTKPLLSKYSASNVVFAVKASTKSKAGTSYSIQIPLTAGILLARLEGSCQPNNGTKSVTPVALKGNCGKFGTQTVDGFKVGDNNYAMLDGTSNKKVTVTAVCK